MKNKVQEYITYYSPEFIYIPYDSVELLNIKKDKTVLNNMSLGRLSNGNAIYSPVSGRLIGAKKSKYLDGEKNSLVIENDFTDRREKLHPFNDISKAKTKEINSILDNYGLYQKINSKTTLVVNSFYNKKNDLGDMVINYESYEEILEAIDELLDLYHIKVCYLSIPKEDLVSEAAYNKYINAFPNICIVHSSKKFKDNKCVFYTIENVLAVYKAIHLDYMLDNTMITISSNDVLIVRVKIFTSLKELLKALKISYKDKTIKINNNVVTSIDDYIIDGSVRSIIIK